MYIIKNYAKNNIVNNIVNKFKNMYLLKSEENLNNIFSISRYK